MILKSSYQQIAINFVLIIAGKLKSIIPTPIYCFCDREQSLHTLDWSLSYYVHVQL